MDQVGGLDVMTPPLTDGLQSDVYQPHMKATDLKTLSHIKAKNPLCHVSASKRTWPRCLQGNKCEDDVNYEDSRRSSDGVGTVSVLFGLQSLTH